MIIQPATQKKITRMAISRGSSRRSAPTRDDPSTISVKKTRFPRRAVGGVLVLWLRSDREGEAYAGPTLAAADIDAAGEGTHERETAADLIAFTRAGLIADPVV
jgi:hypothetical protein